MELCLTGDCGSIQTQKNQAVNEIKSAMKDGFCTNAYRCDHRLWKMKDPEVRVRRFAVSDYVEQNAPNAS
jgi:hypothetical protein